MRKFKCDYPENLDKMWDQRFVNGDIILTPTGADWRFYIAKTEAWACSDIAAADGYSSRSRRLVDCSSISYRKICNIFDFEDSAQMEKVLTSDDLEGRKFIFEFLINEAEKKYKKSKKQEV